MSRIVIISNRLPITIDKKEDGALYYHPSAGGLATGLNSLDDSVEKIWVGWPGREIEDKWEQSAVHSDLLEQSLHPVFLSQQEIACYYEGFSNRTIWPHFHYFTQFTDYDEDNWQAYQQVNQKFADTVLALLQPTDIVWVHDYQLMLVPQLIRAVQPDISIGFFLHIPFPSYEVFRLLPWREELLNGILGADLVGFHTYGYMRHFLSAAYRISGFEHNLGVLKLKQRQVRVDVFPMGIDYDKYAHPEVNLYVDDKTFEIEQLAKKSTLILSIDRLDYTKGIPQRVKAFGEFLAQHPDYQGKVTLMLIVVPSRAEVTQYKNLKTQIDTLVGEVNAQFRSFEWTPIQYFYRSLRFAELTTLYKVADIAMITPLRDGMNLVAKEYVASKELSKRGVLILSEMAGAASELMEALSVNPQDIKGLVQTLHTALSMNEKEQRWRLEKMQKRLRIYNVRKWANTFINEQQQWMEAQKNDQVTLLKSTDQATLLQDYQAAKSRLLVLDYDGTLMNFHNDPQAVVPDNALMEMLHALHDTAGNLVIVNSGRDQPTLNEWLGGIGIDLAAEHGVWVKKNGTWQKSPGLINSWKPKIREVLESMVARTPGSFIEDKQFSLAWHYRTIDRELGEKRVREFREVLLYLTANQDLQVLEGNKVVEIKNAGVNKGKAMMQWLTEDNYDFILTIGDDATDEDTFLAMPDHAYTIKVGHVKTAARYNLRSVEAVRALLQELTAVHR
ncbi:MAG: bifunctional alpha,alpha-trehalose-phosphate synthase (UDP-forming)/trehalose-phosphatase [Saprospiraceae bacterium]